MGATHTRGPKATSHLQHETLRCSQPGLGLTLLSFHCDSIRLLQIGNPRDGGDGQRISDGTKIISSNTRSSSITIITIIAVVTLKPRGVGRELAST